LRSQKLDGLSSQEKHILDKRTSDCVAEAFAKLNKKLSKLPGLTFRIQEQPRTISWGYHSSDQAFSSSGQAGIEWGRAYIEKSIITTLTLLAWAPKEIIRQVAAHEVLHIVYHGQEARWHQLQKPLVASQIVREYPEAVQQEEQWVRNMMEKLGYNENHLELWELAVEETGDKWKPLYYQLKKALR